MGKENNFDPSYEERIKNAEEVDRRKAAARDYNIFIPEMSKNEVDALLLGYTLGDQVIHKPDPHKTKFAGIVVKVSNEYGEIFTHVKFSLEPGNGITTASADSFEKFLERRVKK